jgi:hypothetical protein
LHVLSAPPAFVLSQDQTLHELNSSFERTRLCSFGFFTFTSRYHCGREGRVAFGLLRHGAPVLALPKTRVVNHHRGPLIRFPFASGQFHPAAASVLQSITLDSLSQGVARRKFRSFPSRRASCNAFNLHHLGAPVKGSISRFSSPEPRHRPFRRQPYKVQALRPVVNP